MLPPLPRQLSLGRWPRLALAGICGLLAVSTALDGHHARASRAATVAVVVAARRLPAGHVLSARDVTVRPWPARLRPGTARAGPGDVVGHRLAGPVAAQEPITSTRLLGRDLTSGLGPGTVATPVALDDPHAADLVHAGDRVEVLAAPRPAPDLPVDGASPPVEIVASHALVLAVLTGRPDAFATDTTELVLAVARETATRITRVRSSRAFAVLGDSP